MEGFDTSTMTYMSMSHPHVVNPDGFHKTMLPLDMQDHLSTFDVNTFAGSDDLSYQPFQQHTTPHLKRSFSVYDDQYSDVVSAFDNTIGHETQEGETTSIDRDNKILSFSPPTFDHVLLDYTYRQTTITLCAQLHGMFFLAESPWATTCDGVPPPNELTCYRRNLFQITGSITLPRTLHYILTEQGKQIPILSQELVVSASESTEGNAVKIISVPWKTQITPNAPTTDDKVEREPPSIPLDMLNVQDLDSDFANFPFQWKRLQFRIATANNGRRKELQQHFVVRLKVMATLATGGKISICEVQSGAVIVRGRSPRNFQSRKDMPLNGTGSHARKSITTPVQPSRSSTGDGTRKPQADPPRSVPVKTEAPQPSVSVQSYFDPHDLQIPPDFFDSLLSNPEEQGTIPALEQTPISFIPAHGYPNSSPDMSHSHRPAHTSAPINLSLVEEEPPKRPDVRKPSTPPSRKVATQRPSSFSFANTSSPGDESADLLYEYFPIGLDDWMPPVDAVYRPHVVHHINVSSDPRDPMGAPKAKRSKRYFSEDMGR